MHKRITNIVIWDFHVLFSMQELSKMFSPANVAKSTLPNQSPPPTASIFTYTSNFHILNSLSNTMHSLNVLRYWWWHKLFPSVQSNTSIKMIGLPTKSSKFTNCERLTSVDWLNCLECHNLSIFNGSLFERSNQRICFSFVWLQHYNGTLERKVK